MASGSYQLIWVAGGASGSGTVTLASLPQTGATTGQAIVWNGSAWAPASVAGSGGGTVNSLSGDVTTATADGNGNAVATVAKVGGQTASAVASAVTTIGSATSANTASTPVARDSSGNFSAGTITAALNGNASSATSYTGSVALSQLAQTSATSGQVIAWSGSAWAPATPASGGGTSGITQLNGDVTTPASSSGNTTATVASVGGSSASAVNTAVTTVSAATSSATASTLVARDSSSGFLAGKVGLASGSASANSLYLSSDATTGFYFNNSLIGCAVGNGVIWTANTTTWTCLKAASFSGNVTVGLNLLLSGFSSGTLTVKAASATTSHTYVMPSAQGAASTYLQNDGSGNLSWAAASGGSSGTVTSVALSDASSTPIYTVSGSPVTTSGTLSVALKSQATGTVFCAPATGGAVPTFQSLALGHLPTATAQTVLRSPGTAGASSGSPVWGNVYAPDMLSPGATSGQVLTSTGTSTAPTWQTPSGGGITALTGDVTASGTGSVAATVAQVGGQTSTAVATAATSVANSTSNNTVSTLAARDANGAIQMSTGVTPLNTATITVTAAQSGTTFVPTTGSNTITLIPNPANISYKYKVMGAGGAVSISPPATGTTPTFYYFGGTTTNAINQVNTNTSDCIEFTGLPGSSNYMVSNIQGNWQSGGNALGVYSSLSYPSTSGYVLTANGSTGGASFQAAAGGSSAPNIVASTTTPTASDTGKIFIATTATTATLPVSPATSTQYTYVNGSGGTQTIAQGTGAQVYYGNTATTSGTGGSIVLNGQGSSITIVCQASTNIWYKINSSGQATVT